MSSETTKPATQRVRAIDVKPYRWALWCQIGNGAPFANEIVYRRWSDDGKVIWFGLDNHTGYRAEPDKELDLIPHDGRYSPEMLARVDARDAELMAKRPSVTTERSETP